MKNEQMLRYFRIILEILSYLAALGALFLVGHIEMWSGVAALFAAMLAVIILFLRERKIFSWILFISAIMETVWIFTRIYLLYLIGLYLILLIVIFLVAKDWRAGKKNKQGDKETTVLQKAGAVVSIFLALILLLITLFLSITAATPVPYVKFMQKYMMDGAGNSYEPKENIITEIENGSCKSNILYSEEYPKSYLDIYLTDVVDPQEAPTFIFFHGGGYVWGDKQEGDPNGGNTKGLQWYFQQFINNGYNIVAPNYALAPDYKYPTPAAQLSQAFQFLKDHASEYDLNMNKVILGGNSGGGQLAGILACIQTDPEYAEEIGIDAVFDASDVKAVVFSSALIDNDRSFNTGDPGADFMFLQCGKAYYGWDLLEHKTGIINILDHVTENFPASFISDGNTATFYEQAFDLHEKLDSLGVVNEINWYPRSEAKLGHDFETQATEYSIENIDMILEFLDKTVE